jgi:hypothetical protein
VLNSQCSHGRLSNSAHFELASWAGTGTFGKKIIESQDSWERARTLQRLKNIAPAAVAAEEQFPLDHRRDPDV